MRPTVPLALVFTIGLALAGCVALPGSKVAPAAVAPTVPDLSSLYAYKHDHTDGALHNLSWNLARVAWLPLSADGKPSGIAGEIDVAKDLAAVHFEGARSGFALADVSDPAHPVFLSYTSAEFARPFEARDVKLDPKAEYAYLALQLAGPGAPASAEAVGGFLVYDVKDRVHPSLVAQGVEPGRGCHMIRYWESDGARVVYCASSEGLSVFKLDDTPLGPRTPMKVGVVEPDDATRLAARATALTGQTDPFGAAVTALTLTQPHDMTAEFDPVTHAPILVAAFETYGILVYDIKEPTKPTLLGAWRGEGAKHFARIHTALVAPLAGKRVAVGVTETLGDSTPAFYLVDMTDWTKPAFLAEWTAPGNATSHGIDLSSHNIQVVGTTLTMAHFHAGVWTFDVSDPAHPVPTAVYERREAATPEKAIGPEYWDVVVHRGYVLASDMPSGLVVLKPATEPAGESFV